MTELSVDLDVVARFAPTVGEHAGSLRNLAAWLPANDSDLGVALRQAADDFDTVATNVQTFVREMLNIGIDSINGWTGSADGAERAIFAAAERAANAAAYDALTIADFQMAAGASGPSLDQLRAASPQLDAAIDELLFQYGYSADSSDDPEVQAAILEYVELYYEYFINGGREAGMANPRLTDGFGHAGALPGVPSLEFPKALESLFGLNPNINAAYTPGLEHYDSRVSNFPVLDWEAIYYRAGGYNGQSAVLQYGGIQNIPDDHPYWTSLAWRMTATPEFFDTQLESNLASNVFNTMQGFDYLVLRERSEYELALADYFAEAEAIGDTEERERWLENNPMPAPPTLGLTHLEMFALERLDGYLITGNITDQNLYPDQLNADEFANGRTLADATFTLSNPLLRAALGLEAYTPDGLGLIGAPVQFMAGTVMGAIGVVQGAWAITGQAFTNQQAWQQAWQDSWQDSSHLATNPIESFTGFAQAFADNPAGVTGTIAGGAAFSLALASATLPAKSAALRLAAERNPRLAPLAGRSDVFDAKLTQVNESVTVHPDGRVEVDPDASDQAVIVVGSWTDLARLVRTQLRN